MEKDKNYDHRKMSVMFAYNFFKNESLAFVYIKSEKLAAATYLITKQIPENDLLKASLRNKAISLMESVLLANESVVSEESLVNKISGIVVEILSFIKIANAYGYISDMNLGVLAGEYNNILEILDKKDILDSRLTADTFKKDFFSVQSSSGNDGLAERISAPVTHAFKKTKSYSEIKDKTEYRRSSPAHEGEDAKTRHISVSGNGGREEKLTKPAVRQNERRSAILKSVAQKGKISVKDISETIKNCSGKTLQRELLSMVKEGILAKEGKRRWTLYSIKKDF